MPGEGVCVCPGGVCQRVYTSHPRTEFLTHACENITCPQLRLRTVKIGLNFVMCERTLSPSSDCNSIHTDKLTSNGWDALLWMCRLTESCDYGVNAEVGERE